MRSNKLALRLTSSRSIQAQKRTTAGTFDSMKEWSKEKLLELLLFPSKKD